MIHVRYYKNSKRHLWIYNGSEEEEKKKSLEKLHPLVSAYTIPERTYSFLYRNLRCFYIFLYCIICLLKNTYVDTLSKHGSKPLRKQLPLFAQNTNKLGCLSYQLKTKYKMFSTKHKVLGIFVPRIQYLSSCVFFDAWLLYQSRSIFL